MRKRDNRVSYQGTSSSVPSLTSALNMIQDLLSALVGVGGDIFLESQELRVSQDLPFLQQAEIVLLNELTRTGFYYNQLRLLCESVQIQELESLQLDPGQSEVGFTGTGIYRVALFMALNEILETYVDSVVALERQFILEYNSETLTSQPPLSAISISLSDVGSC